MRFSFTPGNSFSGIFYSQAAFIRSCCVCLLLSIIGYIPTASAASLPDVRVGELSFMVVSLRISADNLGMPNIFSSNTTITLKVTNHDKTPTILNYVSGKTSFVNEFGYSWEEDATPYLLWGRDFIGTHLEKDKTANTYYVVGPESDLMVTIPLVYSGKVGQTTGNSFNFAAEFVSLQDLGEGKIKIIRTYPISFVGLHRTDAPTEVKPDVAKTPEASELHVGNLGFVVTSVRTEDVKNSLGGINPTAKVSMTITNHGDALIALNYDDGKVSLVDENGHYCTDRVKSANQPVIGIPTDTRSTADTGHAIAPGGHVNVTIPLVCNAHKAGDGVNYGTVFDFAADFSAFADMGEGNVRKLRTYPVAFVGLHKDSAMAGGIGDVGDALKKSFGGLFGK